MWALAAVAAAAAWLCGWAATARWLFARWRPSRVPACGKSRHFSSGCHMGCMAAKDCQLAHHTASCYRRRKADLNQVPIDSDSLAARYALLAGAVWPAALLVFALTHSPPELPVEKLARLEQLERDAGIGQ